MLKVWVWKESLISNIKNMNECETCTIFTCFSRMAFLAFSSSANGLLNTEFFDADIAKSGLGSFVALSSTFLKYTFLNDEIQVFDR